MTFLVINFVMHAGDTLQCALATTLMSHGSWVFGTDLRSGLDFSRKRVVPLRLYPALTWTL